MPVYVYKALDAAGKNIKGSIDADSSASAKKKLRDMGLFITQIAETVISTRSRTSPLTIFLFQREKTAFLASFNRQLATLLTAGLPLIRAFDAMIEQQDVPEVKDMTSAVRNAVKEGDTLARAMNKFPDYFPDLMINMIDAGENSGALEITLARLADYYEGKIKLRNQIRSTMAYPIFMSVVGLAVLIFLFIFLIPRVTAIFDQMETTLPLPTRFLIFVSSLVQTYWWCVILLLIVIGFVLFRITQNPHYRLVLDRKRLELPLFGSLYLKLAVARFARTLSTLLAGGLSLFQALDIVKNIMNNSFLTGLIDEVRTSVGEGGSLTAFLREKGIFPAVFLHMTAVGEETGELEQMMTRVADTFEAEVDQTVTTLTSLLEPVMILAMGLVVGIIVIAIMLPIFEMSQVIR